jgi:hypothetical protein
MEDLNKITSTRVGDSIHFFVNGAEDKGTVVKMDTSYVTVVKDDGNFQDIHINDTFFIKDILVNKSWNDMSMEERTVALHEIHAYSPRFLAKAWKELPKELKDVMLEKGKDGKLPAKRNIAGIGLKDSDLDSETSQSHTGESTRTRVRGLDGDYSGDIKTLGDPRSLEKSNVEQSHVGGGGRSSQVVETSTAFDADEDYDGQSDETKEEQFKHEKLKPKVTNKSMQEQIWEQWLDKGEGMGGDSSPAVTSSNNSAQTNDSGMYNPVYGDKGRHGGQGKDKEEDEDKEEDKERKG